jgi:membrane-associated phospholipid phosphatase
MHKFSFSAGVACVAALLSFNVQAQDTTRRMGDVLAVGLPAFAAGLTFVNDDKEGFMQLAKSEGATFLIVEALKASHHEMRPDGSDNKSFPSGHAAVAFSAAQFLQMKGGWEYGVPAYLAASYVGYSRVESHKHYWKDVVAGAATGALTTYYFTDATHGRRLGMSWTGRSASLTYQQAL